MKSVPPRDSGWVSALPTVDSISGEHSATNIAPLQGAESYQMRFVDELLCFFRGDRLNH